MEFQQKIDVADDIVNTSAPPNIAIRGEQLEIKWGRVWAFSPSLQEFFFSLNAYFLFSRHLTLHDSFLYFPFLVNVVIITIIIVIIIKLLLLL